MSWLRFAANLEIVWILTDLKAVNNLDCPLLVISLWSGGNTAFRRFIDDLD